MFVLARAATYSALFIGLLLVFLPGRILSATGIVRPPAIGTPQVTGAILAAAGAALAVACIVTFVVVGKGTPAPFDPPRRLVDRGPYRLVRNPMYIGGRSRARRGGALLSVASLLAYAAAFVCVTHGFVVLYEEPTLRRTFGEDYAAYCRQAGRWWPRRRG